MEFIDGVTLADIIKSTGPPEIALALEIAHQTLLALGYLHRRNLVHRDVAPDNLMLTRDEEGAPRVKVIDLGIAKALDKTVEMTSTGRLSGQGEVLLAGATRGPVQGRGPRRPQRPLLAGHRRFTRC